jgi:DNA-binding response OmpR family regulator
MSPEETEIPTLIVVDDVPANLHVLRQILEPEGFRILVATSGGGALNIARKASPNLVLLDVMMPELDGFDTCRLLHGIPGLENMPVIFITALNEPEAVVKGFQSGGVDYIVKPFQKDEVLARTRTHLKLSQLHNRLSRRNRDLERLAAELLAKQRELEDAFDSIKTLKGLIPICSHCKSIRDDDGFWNRVESYIEKHSDALFSHGICPDCLRKHYGDFYSPPPDPPQC